MNRKPAADQRASPAGVQLPELIMRRAGWVGLTVLLLALGVGLLRMHDDIGDEVAAGQTLAALMAELGRLGERDEAQAIEALRQLLQRHPLRHVVMEVRNGQGDVLLGSSVAPESKGLASTLARWHRALTGAESTAGETWQVPRPDGRPWTVTLTASEDSERQEAIAGLGDLLLMLLLCIAGLLLVMQANLRRALAPLHQLLDSIAGIEAQDTRRVQQLPMMPVAELQALAGALRHLGEALDAAESRRRVLSRQVISLQEDERARLARELHDEFGQRLTAMRVDATWLQRRLAQLSAAAGGADATVIGQLNQLQPVVSGLAEQCALIQHDIREVLQRLQPFDAAQVDQGDAGESLDRVADLLDSLIEAWAAVAPSRALDCQMLRLWQPQAGSPTQAWPSLHPPAQMPRALALALYRMSQEALTNVARHAQAQHVALRLQIEGPIGPGLPLVLTWSVEDDGLGLGDEPARAGLRGNGLAGIRERAWALGSTLQMEPLRRGDDRPGLRLAARFEARWLTSFAEVVPDLP